MLMRSLMEGSVLDVVGAEVVGIVCPVSICMLLVVLLVKQLQSEISTLVLSGVATLVYSEGTADSDWTKFLGALLNAGIFVLVVTLATFMLVLLFYFRCTKCLQVYMGFAAFTVLAYMGGMVAVLLIQNLSIPLDAISGCIILYNFAVVGVMSVFVFKMPIVFTQGYLILVGVLVAFWFASLPEWTTWVLLVAISLYDLVAVLTPAGPLNLLVQLAISRDEEIPALIYEARPVLNNSTGAMNITNINGGSSSTSQSSSAGVQRRRRWKRRAGVSDAVSLSPLKQVLARLQAFRWANRGGEHEPWASNSTQISENSDIERLSSTVPMQDISSSMEPPVISEMQADADYIRSDRGHIESDHERAPLLHSTPMRGLDGRLSQSHDDETDQELDDGVGLGASGAIKLGLGDFIFYSVLVGRAALYDMTTVYACYIAIISGLGATLALLAVWRRALPALPISIALGVIFYFLARFLLEPLIMQCGVNLMFF